MKKLFALGLVGLSSVLCPLFASAQAPQLINYQGRLLNGTNLVNGNVGLSLRLFDAAAAGTLLYEDSNTVTVADGLYSTFIGDNPASAAFLSALTNASVWVEVAVNGVALSPRERLVSVGYSLATRGIAVDAANNIFVLNPAGNSVDITADHSTLGGGGGNSIQANAWSSFLGGGSQNIIQPSSYFSFLGGGNGNSIHAAAFECFLGGGNGNSIHADAFESFLGGGAGNIIQTNAFLSFLGGGSQNIIQPSSYYSFLGGGEGNSVTAAFGMVPGGYQNNAGYLSFAAGTRAKATNSGSFVWADSTDADFGTTSANQFLIRASGGVGIGTNITSGAALNVAGTIKATSFSGDGSGLTNIAGAAIADGSISNSDLSASVLTNISARADSNLVWSTFATATGLTTEQNARIGADASLSNSVASLVTNVAARADSNLVWSTFATAAGLTTEQNARIGADASLSNSVASLVTNVAARLASNVWATANATTNYVRRTGDTMTGILNITPQLVVTNSIGSFTIQNYPVFSNTVLLVELMGATNNAPQLRFSRASGGSFMDIGQNTNGDFVVEGNDVSRLVVQTSGNVGIGTTTPTAPLTVQAATNGAGENTATFYAPAIGFNKSHIHYGTNGDWFIRSASGSGNVILQDTGGRVGIGTSSPTGLLHVAGNAYAQAWLTTSDRNAKQDIAPVDAAAILEKISALPVASWSFKTEPDVKHIGPMAQDFRAAFGLGPNDTSIATVDADGVALAAIQALARQNAELRTANDELKKQFDELRARLDVLEKK